MKCTTWHLFIFSSASSSILSTLLKQKYSVNNIRMGGEKITEKDINKMPPLWMQIVDLSIDLAAASFLPSIPPSISFLFWRYHPSSCSYQFISPHISFLIFPPHHSSSAIFTCQSVCLCVLVCALKKRYLPGQWSEEKTVCIINYSLETGKWQIVKVNECVCICVHALSCLCTDKFCFSVSQEVCLFKYLFPSLYLSLGPICSLRATSVVNITTQTSWVELWLEGRTHGG